MAKRLLLTLWAVCTLTAAHALTLEECLRLARDNYPAIRQYGLVEAAKEYDTDNAGKAWLPAVSVQAGAYAFTDILKQNSAASRAGVDIDNRLAAAAVTVRQTVYDGGRTAAGKRAAAAKWEAEARQTDTDMYAVKARVQEIYFGILLIDEQTRLNDILQADLATAAKNVEDMMRGGVANQSDLDALNAELLSAAQQREAYEATRAAYLKMLGTFVGHVLDSATVIEKPAMPAAGHGAELLRSEMAYFASQDAILDARRRQLDANLRPTLTLMGMGTLHTKLSGMLNKGLVAGGLTLSWDIGALYTRKNDLRKLETLRQQNDARRQTFAFQNRLSQEETNGSVAALRKQLAGDDGIVSLRESIRAAAAKKVAAGTESANELARDINAVNRARVQRAAHEIQLLKALYNLRYLKGEL